MGQVLHNDLLQSGYDSRIYAPIGHFEDLLAYLMRRFLENGANTSFVNKVMEVNLDVETLLINPLKTAKYEVENHDHKIPHPRNIYEGLRDNSSGFDIGYQEHYEMLSKGVEVFNSTNYEAFSIIGGKACKSQEHRIITLPADRQVLLGHVYYATAEQLKHSVDEAEREFSNWSGVNVSDRAKILRRFAELLEGNKLELYSLLMREAGKNIEDAIAEVRETIDFALYYASMAQKICGEPIKLPGYTGESNELSWHPKGVFVCISPWNFPLAIFMGQILAALVCGNTVIAKPADHTCLIAGLAGDLLYKAGVPKQALQFVIARGSDLSENVLLDARIAGVCFTGSTSVARIINRTLAQRDAPIATMIAETGGQNAMIIDSSALLEQAADSIIYSAFGSIGQRCSALRVAFIQEEVYDTLLALLIGYMDELSIGNTLDLSCDLGPVIAVDSVMKLQAHVDSFAHNPHGKVIACHKQHGDKNLQKGCFMMPHIIALDSIEHLKEEHFGPILHVIKYKTSELSKVIKQINHTGFGLTFGIQTRIEGKVLSIAKQMHVGNIYANRTTIGAQVGTHPFGGEGNSGTGFKAGGPHYLYKFMTERVLTINTTAIGGNLELYS
jgi:RHH-type proline utilization regulon transcriptional repressor/proline dehydrogenase/delta 1-pyrroline-5-carboxylate dehydrogenase